MASRANKKWRELVSLRDFERFLAEKSRPDTGSERG